MTDLSDLVFWAIVGSAATYASAFASVEAPSVHLAITAFVIAFVIGVMSINLWARVISTIASRVMADD